MTEKVGKIGIFYVKARRWNISLLFATWASAKNNVRFISSSIIETSFNFGQVKRLTTSQKRASCAYSLFLSFCRCSN